MCYVDIPRKSLCSNSPSLSFAEIESSHLLDCLLDMKQGLLPNSRNSMLTRLLRLCDIREGNGVNVVHFFIQSTIEDVLRVCFFNVFLPPARSVTFPELPRFSICNVPSDLYHVSDSIFHMHPSFSHKTHSVVVSVFCDLDLLSVATLMLLKKSSSSCKKP